MKYEIDIDLGPLADEWEPVAFETPGRGDSFINSVGEIEKSTHKHAYPRLIIRRLWKWPEWLTAEWIAMDRSGIYWMYDVEPHMQNASWNSDSGLRYAFGDLRKLIDFTPPPCTDWKQSKMRNPNAKATT